MRLRRDVTVSVSVECDQALAEDALRDVTAARDAVAEFARSQQALLDGKYPRAPRPAGRGCCGE